MSLEPLSHEEIVKLNQETHQPIDDIAISNRVLTIRFNLINQLLDIHDAMITNHQFKFAREMFNKAFEHLDENHHLKDLDQLSQAENIFQNLNNITDAMRIDINATQETNTALMIEITNCMLQAFDEGIEQLFQVVKDYHLTRFNPYLELNKNDQCVFYTFEYVTEHIDDFQTYQQDIQAITNQGLSDDIHYVTLINGRIELPSLSFFNALSKLMYDAKQQLIKTEK